MTDDSVSTVRVPPHSLEAEQSVLGALLLEPAAYNRVSDLLTDGDFYRHEHKVIFAAVADMATDGAQIDLVTVFERLKANDTDKQIGGLAYLNALMQSVPTSANVRLHGEIVVERARLRQVIALSDQMATAAFNPQGRQAAEILDAAKAQLAFIAADTPAGKAAPLFRTLDMSTVSTTAPAAPEFHWAGYVPSGHVTLLNGHGEAGKSMLGLMLGLHAAVGRPFLGRSTKLSNVAFFSGEDPAPMVMTRLNRILRDMDMAAVDIAGSFHVLDATDADPVLFHEQRAQGLRIGRTTPTFDQLRDFIEEQGIDLLIVDNTSETFDADEINRALVRSFMRALAQLVRDRGGAVLLLGHVDKSTARGMSTGTDSYSGSTAWHNSARSRLFLKKKAEGELELTHEKCNVAPRQQPLVLEWPEGGLPQLIAPRSGVVQGIADRAEIRVLLSLLHEFYGRKDYVATSQNSPSNAARVLSGQASYPKRKPAEVFDLLRSAERQDLIERQTYRSAGRKELERWGLTGQGLALIGLSAPSAPSAPSAEDGTHGARGAPSAPTPGGGYGGRRAHTVGANTEGKGL